MNNWIFWVVAGLVVLALLGDPEGTAPGAVKERTHIMNTHTGQWEAVDGQ